MIAGLFNLVFDDADSAAEMDRMSGINSVMRRTSGRAGFLFGIIGGGGAPEEDTSSLRSSRPASGVLLFLSESCIRPTGIITEVSVLGCRTRPHVPRRSDGSLAPVTAHARIGDASKTAHGFLLKRADSSGVTRSLRVLPAVKRGCVISGDWGSRWDGGTGGESGSPVCCVGAVSLSWLCREVDMLRLTARGATRSEVASICRNV